MADPSASVEDPVADLAKADGDVAGPVGDVAVSAARLGSPQALVVVTGRSLRHPHKLVALADGDHAVPVAELCGSDTDLSDADDFVADAAGDPADFSTQPIRLLGVCSDPWATDWTVCAQRS